MLLLHGSGKKNATVSKSNILSLGKKKKSSSGENVKIIAEIVKNPQHTVIIIPAASTFTM